jgi:hypothetical protein
MPISMPIVEHIGGCFVVSSGKVSIAVDGDFDRGMSELIAYVSQRLIVDYIIWSVANV